MTAINRHTVERAERLRDKDGMTMAAIAARLRVDQTDLASRMGPKSAGRPGCNPGAPANHEQPAKAKNMAYKDSSKDFITVVTAPSHTGKAAELTDGQIVFKSNGQAVAGVAECVHVPDPQSLLSVLESLSSKQYVSPDFIPSLVGAGQFRIHTQSDYLSRFGDASGAPVQDESGCWHTALTTTPGVWEFGKWRVLDRDVDDLTPERFRCDYNEWLALVNELLPGVLTAPRVLWPSSKTRVAVKGGKPVQGLNCHTWVDCTGVELTNAMRGRLRVRANELGMDWSVPRISKKTGEPLPGKGVSRTLFDIGIWTTHRCIYAGAPTVGEGLELLPAAGVVTDGVPLDLCAALPELSSAAVRAYSHRTKTEARVTAAGQLVVTDRESMTLDHEIELADGRVLTVAEFLRDRETDFDTKYRCQTMYRESNSMNGMVRKLRTGTVWHFDNGIGVSYWLPVPDWQFLCDQYQSEKNQEAALTELGTALAWFPKHTYLLRRKQIAERLQVTQGTLDAARAAGRCVDPDHEELKQDREALFKKAVEQRRGQLPRDIVALKDGEDILIELQAHWHLLLGTSKTDAVTFFPESAGTSGSVLRFAQFALPSLRTFCQAYPVDDGDSPVDVWLDQPERSGVRKVTFEPGMPTLYQGAVNLWTGFAVEPVDDEAGCQLILAHIGEVLGGSDPAIGEFILNWLAMRVQGIVNRQPGRLLPRLISALVMRSIQGTGKGLFEQYVAKMFGDHALVTARGSGLTGRFNWQFAHLVLLCADEAFFAGNHEQHDILKSFQSEPAFTFEKKYGDSVSLPNHCAMIMSTNSDWAVPADAGERRMFVFDVSPHRKGDREYFNALGHEMDNGGPAALLGWLLKRDITGFNPEAFPHTEALAEQQSRTLARDSATVSWIEEALTAGEFKLVGHKLDGSKLHYTLPWESCTTRVPRNGVGDAIREHARDVRTYSPPTNMTIGRELKKILGHSGEQKMNDPCVLSGGGRVNAWDLPGLELARERFAEFLKTGCWRE